MPNLTVITFYKFVRLSDYQAWQIRLHDFCVAHELKGTLLLAPEGINGTVAGTRAGVDALLSLLRADPRFADLDHKESAAQGCASAARGSLQPILCSQHSSIHGQRRMPEAAAAQGRAEAKGSASAAGGRSRHPGPLASLSRDTCASLQVAGRAGAAFAHTLPFGKMKVRLKKEIVTLGVPGVDPNAQVGTYVAPEDWNALLADPDVLLIDTRNEYEYQMGTFRGATDPQTATFREFPDYVKKHLDPAQHKKVALFCTGGIRCEKATSFMLGQGFETVYHLQGGILKYLEKIPAENSLWEGKCFVFDERVALGQGLAVPVRPAPTALAEPFASALPCAAAASGILPFAALARPCAAEPSQPHE